jgi:ubiquitin C-terminal hydrolase
LSWILEEDNNVEKEKKSTKELLKLIKPSFWNLNREGNADVDIEVGFEEFMISVSEHTKEDLNTITTFKFYTLLKHINKKHKDGG